MRLPVFIRKVWFNTPPNLKFALAARRLIRAAKPSYIAGTMYETCLESPEKEVKRGWRTEKNLVQAALSPSGEGVRDISVCKRQRTY
jgi:hypothetical protein